MRAARRGRLRIAVGVVVLLACAGCGDGSGDHPATATPTGLPTVSPTPLSPTPTATASPFPEVLLAVGRSFDDPDGAETPLVLRNDGEGWQRVSVASPPLTLFDGIVFSAPETAWAFGFRGDQQTPVLLRSDDVGRSWTDVTETLPANCPGIADMAFASADVGYLVARGILSPRTVFRTSDQGRSWQQLEPFQTGALPGAYALATRGAVAELVRHDSDGLFVVPIDPVGDQTSLSASGGTRITGQDAFVAFGPRGWIAATEPAAILSSAAPGEPWLAQSIDQAFGELRAIDVRDPGNGIAAGRGGTPATTALAPLVLVSDDTETWRRASITGAPADMIVVDVLRERGDGAWALADGISTPVSVFLRSTDGGPSWHREPTEFDHGVRMTDLARNTAMR